MKACSIFVPWHPLCIDGFCTVTHHFLYSRLPLRPSNPRIIWQNPLCESKEQNTQRRLDRATGAVTVNTVQPPRLELGRSVSMVGLIVLIHPHVIPLQSARWCPFFLWPSLASPGPLVALLSFNETFLFVTPELDFSVTGVTALVAELHGGPVVIGASLRRTDSSC